MRRILQAICDALPSSMNAAVGDRTGAMPPYVSVWGPPGNRDHDAPIGPSGAITASVGITCTAQATGIALDMAEAAIQALTPGRDVGALAVDGRHVQIRFSDARPVEIDREVNTPVAHPAYAVLLFDVYAQPAP